MLTIFKGTKSPAVAIALAAGTDYNGTKLVAEYQSARREFTNLAAGQIVRVAFSSEETARFALGTYPLTLSLVNADGDETPLTGAAARIRVTDDPNEVSADLPLVLSAPGKSGATDLAGVEGVHEHFTDNQLRAKVNEIIGKLGGTVTAIALALLLPIAANAASVTTATKGELQNTNAVVTSVDLSGLATTTDVQKAIEGANAANASNVYTKAETDAKIVELAPAPGNYQTVSNAAMSAVSESRATAVAEDVVAKRPILLADANTNLVYVLKAADGLNCGGFYFYAYTNDTSVVNH